MHPISGVITEAMELYVTALGLLPNFNITGSMPLFPSWTPSVEFNFWRPQISLFISRAPMQNDIYSMGVCIDLRPYCNCMILSSFRFVNSKY